MASSAGKRERERQRLEKAKAKADRKAARQAADPESGTTSSRSESELIEELGALHRAFEAGEMSLEEFGERRERLQAEFGELA
jgi:hypothetical protein